MAHIKSEDLPDHTIHTINQETAKMLVALAGYDIKIRTAIAELLLLHCIYWEFPPKKRHEAWESMGECAKITFDLWEKEDKIT